MAVVLEGALAGTLLWSLLRRHRGLPKRKPLKRARVALLMAEQDTGVAYLVLTGMTRRRAGQVWESLEERARGLANGGRCGRLLPGELDDSLEGL